MNRTVLTTAVAACVLLTWGDPARAGTLRREELRAEVGRLVAGFDGRVGVCVRDGASTVSINGDQRFPLQSVMKLVVAAAAMDEIDGGRWRVADEVTVRRQDLSLYVQPIARLARRPGGFRTTVGDLIRRAVVDSDSAATDVLIDRLGGAGQVQAFLDRKGIRGVRIDRDEKRLQTEIVGLQWKPEYVDPDALDRAINAVPETTRDAAFRAYQGDPRDTATPVGMAEFLYDLAAGRLLSPDSTRHLLEVMAATVTFPDRLKAGLPEGWKIGHKTGTSGTWRGVTAATNDVGVVTAPDGGRLAIVVFIADCTAPAKDRAALMASMARATAAHYRPE